MARVKIDVFAPIASVSVTTATIVKPGALARERAASRRSWRVDSMIPVVVRDDRYADGLDFERMRAVSASTSTSPRAAV